jgi:hypothetical protein
MTANVEDDFMNIKSLSVSASMAKVIPLAFVITLGFTTIYESPQYISH